MQVITTTVYRTLGKDFLTEDEAKQFEQEYMKDKCHYKIGDVVYFLDTIGCKIMESKISDITLNDLDDNIYISVEKYDGNLRLSDVYLDINLLIYDLRNNMISLIH